MVSNKQQLYSSFERINQRGHAFYHDFYASLLAKAPNVAKLFNNTDMLKQEKMLAQSLAMAIMESGDSISTYLKHVADIHAKLEISQSDLLAWKSAALATIHKYDSQLSPEEEEAWTQKLDMLLDIFN